MMINVLAGPAEVASRYGQCATTAVLLGAMDALTMHVGIVHLPAGRNTTVR
ncbi:MAG: hypothetical protein U0075_13610 [Thermomicrobiales bacterium]